MDQTQLECALAWFCQDDRPVGVITTFRGANTAEENWRRLRELEDPAQKHFGLWRVSGQFSVDGESEIVSAPSLWMRAEANHNDLLRVLMRDACEKYGQVAFVFKPLGGTTQLFDSRGRPTQPIETSGTNRAGDIFTCLMNANHPGRKYRLESLTDRPHEGLSTAMLRYALRKQGKSDQEIDREIEEMRSHSFYDVAK